MRTAIVFNHPYERSFCAAILQSVVRGLHNAGHETDVLHLDNEQFGQTVRTAKRHYAHNNDEHTFLYVSPDFWKCHQTRAFYRYVLEDGLQEQEMD